MGSIENQIATYGVGSNNDVSSFKYHIFVIDKNGTKLFFTEDMDWSEDINKRAETSDFIFAYEQLGEILNTPQSRDLLEASFLF